MWKVKLDTFKVGNSSLPPLLEQRCNGTAAGLGYLEVGWDSHAKFPPRAVSLADIQRAIRDSDGRAFVRVLRRNTAWVIPLLTLI